MLYEVITHGGHLPRSQPLTQEEAAEQHDEQGLHTHEEQEGEDDRHVLTERTRDRPEEEEVRITSYNVCYTKLLRTAAHELRTPLCAMMGFTELMLSPDEYGSFSPEQRHDFLREIYDRGVSLTRIIDDLRNNFV